MARPPELLTPVPIEKQLRTDLLRRAFALMPLESDTSIDRERVHGVGVILDELRRRAVESQNLNALRDVHTLEVEINGRLQRIQDRVGTRAAFNGLVAATGLA